MTTNNQYNELECDVSSDSRITKVTVYPDLAEITRTFQIELQAGVTNVKFVGEIPYTEDPPLIYRVEKSAANVNHRDVVIAKVPPKPPLQDASTGAPFDDVLKAFEEEKALLEKSLSRYELSSALLDEVMKGTDLRKISITLMVEAVKAYSEQGEKCDKKIQNLKREIRSIEKSIQNLKNPPTVAQPSEAHHFSNHLIQFTLETDSPISTEVRLVYLEKNASWIADYDVAVTSVNSLEEPKISISYCALIKNATAEVWEDIALTLETAPFMHQGRELSVRSWGRWEPPQGISENQSVSSASRSLPGKISISQGKQKITIARFKPEVLFERYCTPRLDFRVVLKGKVTNNFEIPLCAGDGHIYCDGNYVTSTTISATEVGETITIPLGFDPKVIVRYSLLTKGTTHIPGMWGQTGRVSHDFSRCITVGNTRTIAISSLTIMEQYPPNGPEEGVWPALTFPPLQEDVSPVSLTDGIPDGCAVTVMWDKIEYLPESYGDFGKTGLIKWVCVVGSGKEINLDISWYVSH